MMKVAHGILRRSRLDLATLPELAIRQAIEEVEEIGADQRLTEAVILLGRALGLVGDVIDDRMQGRG